MTAPPAPNEPPPQAPARAFGAPREGAVLRLETVRVTAPDLTRRAALLRSRRRLAFSAAFFVALFAAVAVRLAMVTVIDPREPPLAQRVAAGPLPLSLPPPRRAMIVDRNGQILALSLPSAALFADPHQIYDPRAVAATLARVIPGLDQATIAKRLAANSAFAYIAREITAEQMIAINNLGIPGLYFQPSEQRRYPMQRLAAQLLGATDVDENGIAGVEKQFNRRLFTDPNPLRLSIDVRVQAILREELARTIKEFHAKGGCGIVMSATNARVLAMVSLPDYDANDFAAVPAQSRFNRCVAADYEPGSVFKLQTAAMALDSGLIHLWDRFDTTHPLQVSGYTITDYEPVIRWLYLPEIVAYSSNIGASRIALIIGARHQRAWLGKLGFFGREGIELPEAALPEAQSRQQWGKAAVMTVSFGNGIAVTPLHLITTFVALVDGGVLYRPTLLAAAPGAPPRQGVRVMRRQTSEDIRKLLRLVVLKGTGTLAQVPGYFVGGKTGTSQKVEHGVYRRHTNMSSFIAAFPINAPRYAIYILIDSPTGNKKTYGFATGGFIAAPAVAQVIARIGPMLGVMPETADRTAIDAALRLSLHPKPPLGVVALGPGHPLPPRPAGARLSETPPAILPTPPIAPITLPPIRRAGLADHAQLAAC